MGLQFVAGVMGVGAWPPCEGELVSTTSHEQDRMRTFVPSADFLFKVAMAP